MRQTLLCQSTIWILLLHLTSWMDSIVYTASAFTTRFQLCPRYHRHQDMCAIMTSPEQARLFMFGKWFEPRGPLGKGITIGKVQIALLAQERGRNSIFDDLERKARSTGYSQAHLALLAREVSLALLRKSDDWISAYSEKKWFSSRDAATAEYIFNEWADREALSFDKEYIPPESTDEKGRSTLVVVSLLVEIQGDETIFDDAGTTLQTTKDILTSIASNAVVADGEVLHAVEVFWTPSDRKEVMTGTDLVVDFPNLLTL